MEQIKKQNKKVHFLGWKWEIKERKWCKNGVGAKKIDSFGK
jgi:hypothetical protein